MSLIETPLSHDCKPNHIVTITETAAAYINRLQEGNEVWVSVPRAYHCAVTSLDVDAVKGN